MKKQLIIIVIIIIMIVGGIFIFTKTDKTDELVGLWDFDGNTKYEFDGKSNGKVIVPNSEFEFTYEINDNTLSIDFIKEESIDAQYEFKVSENELELKDLKQLNVNLKLKRIEK